MAGVHARWRAAPPHDSGESGSGAGQSGSPAAESEPPRFDDRLARALGIPLFGLVIPRATGLVALPWPHGAIEWLGSLGFVGLAAAIWHGNRWLLFAQRRHLGWFDHPAQKVMTLLAAIVLYTVPVTLAGLWLWFAVSGRAIDLDAMRTVVLANVICVVFVAHAYETVLLVKERASDLVRVAELDRAQAQAALDGFLAQVDPHFLFNALNTLGHLIDTDTVAARRFADMMGDLYRYLLRQRGRALVDLDEELAFVHEYVELMQLRLGGAVRLALIDRRGGQPCTVPPTALQVLVENAIKHNAASRDDPLVVTITLERDHAEVEHRRRPRRSLQPREGVGLRNLGERLRLATGRTLAVVATAERFTVTVPLVAATTSESHADRRARG